VDHRLLADLAEVRWRRPAAGMMQYTSFMHYNLCCSWLCRTHTPLNGALSWLCPLR